jgi:hypothetical protein
LDDKGIGQSVEYSGIVREKGIGRYRNRNYKDGGQDVNIIIGNCKEEIRYKTRK